MSREEIKTGNETPPALSKELPSANDPTAAVSSDEPEPEGTDGRRSKKQFQALKGGLAILALALSLYFAIPWAVRAFNTISTDDAYVNGHVTFVAAHVAGQVMKIMVEDNNRVHRGDLLMELDRQPYADQVGVKQAAVELAQADLAAARAQARDPGDGPK